MYPGNGGVVLLLAETRQRRGARADFAERMLRELKNVLGEANVVLK